MATKPPSATQQLKDLDLKNLNLKDINIRRLLFVRRYLFISAAMGIAGTILIFLVIVPQIQQILSTQAKIRQESTALASLQTKIRGLRQVNGLKEYASRDKVDLALPFQKPLIPLLDASRRVSEESLARIVAIETSPGKIGSASAKRALAVTDPNAPAVPTTDPGAVPPPVQGPIDPDAVQVHGVDKMNVTITVEGTLDQISDFVSRIERSTPATNVTEIQLKEAEDPEAATKVPKEFQADLQLSSYYFTRAIEVAIDTPLPETGAREFAFLDQLEQYTVTLPQVNQGAVEGGGRQDLFGTGVNALPSAGEGTTAQ